MPLTARRAEAGDAVVGRNIRMHRLARGLSQTDLGDGIGVTFQQVQKYEKGMNRVGAARLMRIANTLNVPVALLLAGIDGPKTDEASPVALLQKREPLRLLQAYDTIGDRRVKRGLRELVEAIARVTRRG